MVPKSQLIDLVGEMRSVVGSGSNNNGRDHVSVKVGPTLIVGGNEQLTLTMARIGMQIKYGQIN